MKSRRFYRKSFYVVLFISCLPTFLIGFFVYIFGTTHIQREVMEMHEGQVVQSLVAINTSLSDLETKAGQWVLNPTIDNHMNMVDFNIHFDVTRSILNALTVMKGADSLIQDMYLYMDITGVVISDVTGVVRMNETQRESYMQLLREPQTVRWVSTPANLREGNSYIAAKSLLVALPVNGSARYGALIVTLDTRKLSMLLRQLNPREDGAQLLLDEAGSIISGGTGQSSASSIVESSLRDMALAHKDSDLSRIMEWEGQEYSVYIKRFNRLGETWILATAVSMSKLTAPVVKLSQFISGFSLLGFIVALILAWLGSRRLYSPIRRLLDKTTSAGTVKTNIQAQDEFDLLEQQWSYMTRESVVLQERLEASLPMLREGFMLQLVQGHLQFLKEEELRLRMQQLGWDTEGKIAATVFVQLNGFANLTGRFSEGDEQLVTFAAANIAGELANKHHAQSSIINFQDLSVGIILLYPDRAETAAVRRDLFHLAEELADTLGYLIRMEVTVCIGKLLKQYGVIPEALKEGRRAAQYREVNRPSQIMDMEELLPDGTGAAISYPFDTEKELIQAMRMGLEEHAEELLERFVTELEASGRKHAVIRQGMLQLMGNIQFAMLQAGYCSAHTPDGDNLYARLLSVTGTEEMKAWFKENLLRPYLKELAVAQIDQYFRLAHDVMDYISKHYQTDLSLESVADHFGTYHQKVSTAFKRATGTNFIDYLTEFRLEKAKSLLVETDTKINDVAESVGYQPSYFNRLFKRREGITPGQYREKFKLV